MERPKIIGRNPVSKKYVMWFHCDQLNFGMKSVGVLTADAITGPYSFASPCFKPDGQDSYDMGTYWDDAAAGGDGHAYLIRSVRNAFAGISQLTPDWTNTTAAGIVSQGPDMEGQALMRDAATGTLYAAGSHLTGWAANPAQFVVSPNASLVGAQWGDNYNPSGDSTTWNSQSTFIFPFKHADGHVTYIWMAGEREEIRRRCSSLFSDGTGGSSGSSVVQPAPSSFTRPYPPLHTRSLQTAGMQTAPAAWIT